MYAHEGFLSGFDWPWMFPIAMIAMMVLCFLLKRKLMGGMKCGPCTSGAKGNKPTVFSDKSAGPMSCWFFNPFLNSGEKQKDAGVPSSRPLSVVGVKRRLAAIMSADVKEYSRLLHEDEEATVRTLTAYRKVMTTLVHKHRGRVVDSPGDNLLAEFASVVDAVNGAIAIQKALDARNSELPESRKMEYRIGISLGDVIVDGERIYGDGVNIAARLEGLSDPGGVLISHTAYDQIENKLPIRYEHLGEKKVRNISKPVRVYNVLFRPEVRSEPAGDEEPAGHLAKAGNLGSY